MRQRGVFAVDQLGPHDRDLVTRRVRAKVWFKVAPGVYRLGGAPRSWEQSLIAALLFWGQGSVISHRAAAALWKLAGFEPGPVEVTVPVGRRGKGPGVVHRNALSPRDVTTIGGIRVTRIERTLVDLAALCHVNVVEEALDDAIARGLTDVVRMRRWLDGIARSGRPGVAVLRSLLDALDPTMPVSQSVFETRLRRVLREAGLPQPVRQYEVFGGDRMIARVDYAYPDHRLAIEADSRRYHTGPKDFERDRERGNALALVDWRMLRITWRRLVEDPGGVAADVRRALGIATFGD